MQPCRGIRQLPSGLRHRQIWVGNVPSLGCDLMLGNKVFYRWAVDSRPTLDIAEQQIHCIGNLGHEVVDVGVPFPVVGGGEEQFCVFIQEDEAHIVKGANGISAPKVAFQCLQQSAKSLRSAFCERDDPSEFRDFALTGADPPGVLRPRRRCELSFESG